MYRFIVGLVLPLLLVACVTPPPKVEVPVAWAQTTEERGKLPVGRVVSVELTKYETGNKEAMGVYSSIVMVTGPVGALVAAPLMAVKSEQAFYRYTIQLKGVATPIQRDEFVVYTVGSCVALREKPFMVVPALPDECE